MKYHDVIARKDLPGLRTGLYGDAAQEHFITEFRPVCPEAIEAIAMFDLAPTFVGVEIDALQVRDKSLKRGAKI